MYKLIAKTLALVAATGATSAGAATITVSGGSGEVIATPATVTNVDLFSQDGILSAFNEASGVVLARNLKIEKVDDVAVKIGAGTTVDSHMIFYNPEQGAQDIATATFTFSEAILNVIRLPGWLNGSHAQVGAAGTVYGVLDGGEFGPYSQDNVTILNPFTLTLTSMVKAENDREYGDWFRVITRSADDHTQRTLAPVPVPASGLLLSLGLAGIVALRRRRR